MFKSYHTVDVIVSEFSKVIDRLESLEAFAKTKITNLQEEIKAAEDAISYHSEEANRAAAVRNKLKDLLSV